MALIEQAVELQRLKRRDARKDGVIGYKSGCVGLRRSGRLDGIRHFEPVLRPEFRREIGNLQVRSDPNQIGISREQPEVLINPPQVRVTVWLNQKFGHCHSGCNRAVIWPGDRLKNSVRKLHIARIAFQFIDEDARVDSNAAVPLEKGGELLHFQLWRSLRTYPRG
jgi:hypothetical protein